MPLIGLSSELVDGFEPHGLIHLRYTAVRHGDQPASEHAVGRVYPGWWVLGGCWVGTIPGTNPAAQFEAYLR